jgi:hypothetical protein
MSVGGTSGAGGAGASSTSSTSTGTSTTSSTTSSTTTTASGTNGATTTSGSTTQTAQATAAANGASISGQTETGNSQVATGDPAALGQQSFAVDANAIASLPAAEQALATQFSIAIVRAQQEEMARAQQPTDPSMAQQAFDSLKGFVNETRLNAVTALESFAKQLSERMQTNPEAFDDANKLLNALPSSIAINAMVGEIQAQNPEDAAALKATLDSFVQRQITALEKGEVSPEVAGLAAIAALVAAYKLAPKGELTAVVQSLAKPIANAFAAARSRLSVSFDSNALGTVGGTVRLGGLSSLKSMGLEGVDLAGRSFNSGRKSLENAGFVLTETTETGRKVFTHPKTRAQVFYDSNDALVGAQKPHWHIRDLAGNRYNRSGRIVGSSDESGHIPGAR